VAAGYRSVGLQYGENRSWLKSRKSGQSGWLKWRRRRPHERYGAGESQRKCGIRNMAGDIGAASASASAESIHKRVATSSILGGGGGGVACAAELINTFSISVGAASIMSMQCESVL